MGKKSSKLQSEVVCDLAQKTHFDENEIKKWHKGFLEDCPDGTLDIEKLEQIYRKYFTKGNPQKFANFAFRAYDRNGDGGIDFGEFITALSITTRGSMEEKLQWVFSMYDLNSDGHISKEEMQEVIIAVFKMVGDMSDFSTDGFTPERSVEKIFEQLDINNNGEITLDEFMEGVQNHPTMRKLLQIP